MDFRGRRHERGSNWTDPEIVELLQLWSDESVQIELESSLRNQRVFDRIAQILRDKGIYRTGDQCREKIKKMKLEYRRIKDNHKLRSWKFYDVMDRVLANRPAITYSSLGGAVIAQQVFQNPGGPDSYLQGMQPGSFGPMSSGGFLFGQPPRGGDPLDIKCEAGEDAVLHSNVGPPQMYYGSTDEQETDAQSLLEPEDTPGRGDVPANTQISPSGFDLNVSGSTTQASNEPAGGPTSGQGAEQPRNLRPCHPAGMRQRKRRRGGKGSWVHGGCGMSGQSRLDKALVSFLSWQRSAEERLLSLEEARLEREQQTEERREQWEEKRAERERQHELRLFSMLTDALAAVRRDADVPVSPVARLLAPTLSGATPSRPRLGDAVSSEDSAEGATDLAPRTGGVAGREVPGSSVYLSNRGNNIRQHRGIMQEGFAQYHQNRYHETDNPEGIINMATSENKLCCDLLQKRLTRPDMLHVEPALLQYSDWRGHRFLREEVARFLSHYCGSPSPLKADNVVVMNGCTSLFSAIAAVICDPKDAILMPTPFYGVISEDVGYYSDVKLFHVPLDCEADGKDGRPFYLTVDKLEEGLERAKREEVVVRAVVLLNPHNPLADIYTPEEMVGFLEFAKRHKLHAIVDEIYMLTVFDESVTFRSVLSLDSLPDPNRTHVMWGLTKDFAAAGMRIGTLYTENQAVVEALGQLGAFHGICGPTQHQVAQLLKDRAWIDEVFLPENRRRLRAAHSFVTSELQRLGVPFLHRPATLFLWVDLRKYLQTPSLEDEMRLWERFLQHRVVLSCGQAFSCTTPGWFRIVFSDQQRHLELGMQRLREVLEETETSRPDPDLLKEDREDHVASTEGDGADSDNAAIVNSTSSPEGRTAEGAEREQDRPAPHADQIPSLDLQACRPSDSLDSLIGTLRQQIGSSDWLEKNTPELSAGEDPQLLHVFTNLLQRAKN